MHPDGQRRERAPRSTSWAHRALGAGGRALGSAGHALTSVEQRGSSHLGTAHLGVEALVAYVDGELGMGAHQRAAAHLAVCTECACEVQAQLQARAAVRAAGTPCTPAGLLGALRQIPEAQAPRLLPPPGATVRGAVVQGDNGAWVSVLRPERYDSTAVPAATDGNDANTVRTRRHGFPLMVLGVSALAVGVLVTAATAATESPVSASGVAPVHVVGGSAPTGPAATPVTVTLVLGVAAGAQTAASPSAGQARPAGVPAQV